jgi:ribosomal protein L37AE/L43A
MISSRAIKIGSASLGAVLLIWLAITLFFTPGDGPNTLVDDPTHCPDCGRVLPKYYQGTGECPYCIAESKGGGQKKLSRAARARQVKPTIPIILGCALILLASIHVGLAVHKRVKANKQEVLFHLDCPKCKRKLRYRENQVGKVGQCPICRRPLIFPPPIEMPETRWMRFRRWLRFRPSGQTTKDTKNTRPTRSHSV